MGYAMYYYFPIVGTIYVEAMPLVYFSHTNFNCKSDLLVLHQFIRPTDGAPSFSKQGAVSFKLLKFLVHADQALNAQFLKSNSNHTVHICHELLVDLVQQL